MKMPTELIANEAELKRYLYSEMPEDEHAEMEERLFLNDDLFYEAVDLENRLVDLYVQGKLNDDERTRFERALATQPERKQKVANASALQEFISEERPQVRPTVTIVERTIWGKLSDYFQLRPLSLGYGMAGLVLVLAFLSVFLVLDNRRKANDIARLQGEQVKLDQLESELAATRSREGELQSLVDAERDASGDLSDELQAERTRRERIESELVKLKQKRDAAPPDVSRPTIATLVLLPLGGRGGGEAEDLAIAADVKRVAIQLNLPGEAPSQERYAVSLNAKPIVRNLAPRASSGGKKSLTVSLLPKDIDEGLNRISVTNSKGIEVSKYWFNVRKK